MPIIISIEGNIGSGKSSLIDKLKTYYSNYKKCKIIFISEPIDIWKSIVDDNNNNLLNLYYQDQNKYSFPFQIMTLSSRINQINNLINKYDIIITERSLFTDKNVFAKMLYDSKKIDSISFKIYNYLFDQFDKNYEIYYYFIDIPPDICIQRITKRNRIEEKSVSLDYIKECDKYHKEWLKNEKLVTINNELNLNKMTINFFIYFKSFINYLPSAYFILKDLKE